MNMKDLKSSNIAACGYDPASGRLLVRFNSGTIYAYENVAPEHHAGLCAAESPGRYFRQTILGAYDGKKQEGE